MLYFVYVNYNFIDPDLTKKVNNLSNIKLNVVTL